MLVCLHGLLLSDFRFSASLHYVVSALRLRDLFRDVAIEREYKAHDLVTQISGRIKHARATTLYNRDAVLASIVGRRFGDTAGTGTAVHPDVLDPKLGTLAHRLLGDLRARSDHDRLYAPRDRAQIVIGRVTFNLVCVRVYGEHLISALFKASVDDIGTVVLGCSSDPGDGHPPVGQEIGGSL